MVSLIRVDQARKKYNNYQTGENWLVEFTVVGRNEKKSKLKI